MNESFAAFILTNGRPNNVKTIKTLLRCGYTGKIYLLVDNEDKTLNQYKEKYGDMVIVFDKEAISKTFDQADNFNDKRAIIYARNASFEVAKKLKILYFIQLDDDYVSFDYRFDNNLYYQIAPKKIKSLDKIFSILINYMINNERIASVALSQNGDFIGGSESKLAQQITLKRKAMNSFICCSERPFKFIGRINEDVNTYTYKASTGLLFFTFNQISLQQTTTQKSSGGMTELYLDSGTYIKSFYSVMFQPSSVKVKLLNSTHKRLHHSINWKKTVPMIIRETNKKY